jgi:hypothetical protein
MNLQIRKATLDDLDRLMEIFEEARRFMCRTGNPNQWINGYPQRELIQEEISIPEILEFFITLRVMQVILSWDII